MKSMIICIALLISANAFEASPVENAKIGVALYSFHKHTLEDALKMAQNSGVEYMEGFSFYKLGGSFGNKTMKDVSDEEIAQMKELFKAHHLSMTSMYVGDAKDVHEWKQYFESGKKFGIKYFVCEPPVSQLDLIDSLGAVYNIKIAIHEHSKQSGSIYWHPDSVLAAIKGRKNIGACADIGHWVRSGLDPVVCVRKLAGHIIGMHMKDVDPSNEDVDPGTGRINFDALFRELKRQKFAGYMQIECEHNMDNNLADVKKARQYYDAKIKATGY